MATSGADRVWNVISKVDVGLLNYNPSKGAHETFRLFTSFLPFGKREEGCHYYISGTFTRLDMSGMGQKHKRQLLR